MGPDTNPEMEPAVTTAAGGGTPAPGTMAEINGADVFCSYNGKASVGSTEGHRCKCQV